MSQQSDLTPLEILLHAMRRKWTDGDCDGAVSIARIAAPYLHPRCGGILRTIQPQRELNRLTDAQLVARLAELDRGVEPAPGDPHQPD